jgi:hypothetical protein
MKNNPKMDSACAVKAGQSFVADASSGNPGGFVISLDFELMWGVRDARTISEYGANILGARKAVPRLLEFFRKCGVACTWATVGMLFFDNKDELLATLPEIKPAYRNLERSPYKDIKGIGQNEEADPYHYGLSLIEQIKSTPRQEIGTHTFSHYYCLEEGETLDAFDADLEAAKIAARRIGVELKSIVFPRNQYSQKHIESCRKAGLLVFRGNGEHPIYKPVAQNELTPRLRAARLIDSYLNISGTNSSRPNIVDGLLDVPASRFLRPWSRSLRRLEPLRLGRILSAMRASAQQGSVFHIWFHPHNFGVNQDENFSVLNQILEEYRRLHDAFGWPSLSMAEVAEKMNGRGTYA